MFDNIFIERLWRSVKYEEVFLHEYQPLRLPGLKPGVCSGLILSTTHPVFLSGWCRTYQTVAEAKKRLGEYFRFYNEERLHEALDYRTPSTVYFGTSASMMPTAAGMA